MFLPRPAIFSVESIYQAYLRCRSGKRHTLGAILFEQRLAEEISALEHELTSRTYRPRPAERFVTQRPKLREIVAAEFRDRVVHHLLVSKLEPDWERVFIGDSFACRCGKGTHAAVARLEHFVRSATRGGSCVAHYLQADVQSFFMSIDRKLLFARLDRRLRKRFGLLHEEDLADAGAAVCPQAVLPLPREHARLDAGAWQEYDAWRWLTAVLVFHDPLAGCKMRGRTSLLAKVPVHKTLGGCRPGCGLPIGNLTSQFFANVYLDAMDQYVKHTLGVRFYLRYVDDIVLIDRDLDRLRAYGVAIEGFLGRVLRLQLNPRRTRLRSVSCGIDFLGYVVHPTHRLVRRRVVGNLCAKLLWFERRLVQHMILGEMSEASGSYQVRVYRYPQREVQRLQAVLSSYLAHMVKANTYKLVKSIWARRQWLSEYFVLAENKVVPRYAKRACCRCLRDQRAWFLSQVGDDVLCFQVGSHFELSCRDATKLGQVLELDRGTRRGWLGHRRWIRRPLLARYLKLAAQVGVAVTVVVETGRRLERVAERTVRLRMVR